MKKHLLFALFLFAILPISGQTNSELIKENAMLKAELRQTKEQLATTNRLIVELTTRIKVAKTVLSELNSDSIAQKIPNPVATSTPSVSYSTITSNIESTAAVKAIQNQKQCKAITQAGTICKRMSAEGSDYCWQHQPKATTTSKSTGTSSSGKTIYTGSKGGKYYINSNGNKTYIKR